LSQRIEDYGLIGDCQTAALVGRNGSIDWLCLPRFDSGACFAALLGTDANGRWLLAPKDKKYKVSRCYRPGTLILETTFELESGGAVRITDFMPIRRELADLVRIVEGLSSEVAVEMDLVLRLDYGSITPWIQQLNGAISLIAGPDRLTLRSPIKLENKDGRLVSEFSVRKGQQLAFNLTWSHSSQRIPKAVNSRRALLQTERWWKEWKKQCTLGGEWGDVISRSLITLKAMTYMPTGGVVAAVTTSLPEKIGGIRNWDYRYCWLRDASFTLSALLSCGCVEEANAWLNWLLRATAGHPSELQVLYGVAGERRLTEFKVHWLQGYESSTPVRIGNAATNQFQLDVFGEILDAVHKWWSLTRNVSEFGWTLIRSMIDFLEKAWHRPDEGIWEVRGPRRQFTHSKLMAWVAFDRVIEIAERTEFDGPVEKWRKIREKIRKDICKKAFNQDLNSFVQYYGASLLDAAVLRMPLVGFLPIEDERIQGTIAAIEKKLMVDGFLHRYESSAEVDGLPEGEGSFTMCTLWYADVLHMSGREEEAEQVLKRVLGVCNDLGLLSEMYDPKLKRQVGNFPQAFSHVGLVNTALRLSGRGVPEKPRKGSRAAKGAKLPRRSQNV